jgi:hypothetical protein
VIDLELSWPEAAAVGGCLAAATVALRLGAVAGRGRPPAGLAGPHRPGRQRLAATAVLTGETALVLGLFALWQFAGSFSVMGPAGALSRARWLWHAERLLRLPDEASLQRAFLPHPLLVQALNLYYAALHFPVLIACMIWLFARHRDHYTRLRTTLVAFTGLCLLIQLIPVAPPRMLPGIGMIDTAVRYGQSVYATAAGFEPDQLSAMPSVHVGWAILVAIVVIGSARTRWRWLAAAYPALTTLAVVVTANHFWLDGIVAGVLLVAVLLAQAGGRRLVVHTQSVILRRGLATETQPAAAARLSSQPAARQAGTDS